MHRAQSTTQTNNQEFSSDFLEQNADLKRKGINLTSVYMGIDGEI